MAGARYRLTLAVYAALVVFVALQISGFGVWREIAVRQPQFDMVVEVDAPHNLGCFEAYINANYESPFRACLTHDGPSTLNLAKVPGRISTIRFDTGDESDVEFTLKSVKFATSNAYLPAPRRTLREYQPSDIATWIPSDVTVDGNTGRVRTASRDPQLHAKLDLDLFATLDATPKGIELLSELPRSLLAMLSAELVLATVLILIVWKTARGASPVERNNAWIAALCVTGFIATVVSAFPGHTNYDELFSLAEYWGSGLTDTHPPLHTIVWSGLMDIGRAVGLDPLQQAALVLVMQAALFWSAAGVLASWLRSKWLARGFLLVFAFSPVTLVYLGGISKDSQLAIALFVAAVWLALAVKRRSVTILILTAMPLFYAFAIRSNGPVAVLPLCFFWVTAAYKIHGINLDSTRRRLVAISLSAAFFVSLLGATQGLSRLVIQNPCCYGEQVFMTFIYDLMGVSVRVGENLVPRQFHQDSTYDLEIIKQRFSQYTLNFDGITRIKPPLFLPLVKVWFHTLWTHPKEFARHRLMVLGNFFGFYSGPAPAPYMTRFLVGAGSIQLPDRASAIMATYENMGPPFLDVRNFFEAYFGLSRNWPVYRIWVYMVVLAAVFAIPTPRSPTIENPAVWLTASSIFYLLPYLLLANSALFRYLWWPALAMFTASILRIDTVLSCLRPKQRIRPRISTTAGEL